jgi:DNA-binding phage protein
MERQQIRDKSRDEAMAELFRIDPSYGRALLAEVLRDGDSAELAILLRQLQKAGSKVCYG